jgi:hypothetical protein
MTFLMLNIIGVAGFIGTTLIGGMLMDTCTGP